MSNRKIDDYTSITYLYKSFTLATLSNNKTKTHFVIKSMAYRHHSKNRI